MLSTDTNPDRSVESGSRLVEVCTPPHDWVRIITSVHPLAKNGYDWGGDFLAVNTIVDLKAGDLLVSCKCDYFGRPGKRKRRAVQRIKRVFLWQVMANTVHCHPDYDRHLRLVETIDSEHWGFYLREKARELLIPKTEKPPRKFRQE